MRDDFPIHSALEELVSRFIREEKKKPLVFPEQGPHQPLQLQVQRLVMGFDCYLKPLLSELIQWTQSSRETQNFTYTLTQSNIYQLSGWVSVISGCTLQQAKLWILELISDEVLRQHLNQLTSASKYAIGSDLNMGYGRRLGWYALVRALKPRTVVETGVDKGLGSCVLAAALLRNRSEGYPGFYFGTDINPSAGWLFQGKYKDIGQIFYGDSIESLQRFEGAIDLFINDSDHSAEYEQREYACIQSKLSARSVLLGDNAHVTDALYNFALDTGRRFLFFSEKPADHWYSGAGIGAAWGKDHPISSTDGPHLF